MKAHDFKLKDGLKAWRTEQMEQEFSGDDFFGPQLLLSDEILNRIVDLAHKNKLTDIQSLHEQTDWRHSSKYGAVIIEMVKSCAPPPPPPPVPTPSSSGSASSSQLALQGVSNSLSQIAQNPQVSVPKKSRHCATCGGQDHICTCLSPITH
jgi:hypothetical protein